MTSQWLALQLTLNGGRFDVNDASLGHSQLDEPFRLAVKNINQLPPSLLEALGAWGIKSIDIAVTADVGLRASCVINDNGEALIALPVGFVCRSFLLAALLVKHNNEPRIQYLNSPLDPDYNYTQNRPIDVEQDIKPLAHPVFAGYEDSAKYWLDVRRLSSHVGDLGEYGYSVIFISERCIELALTHELSHLVGGHIGFRNAMNLDSARTTWLGIHKPLLYAGLECAADFDSGWQVSESLIAREPADSFPPRSLRAYLFGFISITYAGLRSRVDRFIYGSARHQGYLEPSVRWWQVVQGLMGPLYRLTSEPEESAALRSAEQSGFEDAMFSFNSLSLEYSPEVLISPIKTGSGNGPATHHMALSQDLSDAYRRCAVRMAEAYNKYPTLQESLQYENTAQDLGDMQKIHEDFVETSKKVINR